MKPPNYHKPDECPYCFYAVDSAANADGTQPEARPSPGDFCVCVNCGGISTFDAQQNLQAADDDTIAAASDEERALLLRAQRIVRECGPIFSNQPTTDPHRP